MSALDMWHLFAAAQRRRLEQWSGPDQLAELRARRLRRLAVMAAHTPYYRSIFERAGIAPAELTDGTLESVPVLEKSTLRGPDAGQMMPDPGAKLFPVNTSGSTGVPLQVLRNGRDQAEVSAVWARIFAAYGRRTWDRQVNIGSGRAVA